MFLSLMENATLLAQTASDPWADWFFGLNTDERFPLLVIAIGCGTGIVIASVAIITGLVNSLHRRNAETAMKQDLLDRGMTADEIATVIRAESGAAEPPRAHNA